MDEQIDTVFLRGIEQIYQSEDPSSLLDYLIDGFEILFKLNKTVWLKCTKTRMAYEIRVAYKSSDGRKRTRFQTGSYNRGLNSATLIPARQSRHLRRVN